MKSTFYAVAMTAISVQASMLKSSPAVTNQPAAPAYGDVWEWLEANYNSRTTDDRANIDRHLYSRTTSMVRDAMYISLAEDISRFIAEEVPADLMRAHESIPNDTVIDA